MVHGYMEENHGRNTYVVEYDDANTVVDTKLVHAEDISDHANVFTLVWLYHHHKQTSEFQRRISYVLDSSGQLVTYAVIQYLFDEGSYRGFCNYATPW